MKLYQIKTNLGYYIGQSSDVYPIQLGCGYQNNGLNIIEFGNKDDATEFTKRALGNVITSICNIINENLENIKFINIEINES